MTVIKKRTDRNKRPAAAAAVSAWLATAAAIAALLAAPAGAEQGPSPSELSPEESAYTVREIVEDGSWNYRGRPTTDIADGKLFVAYVSSEGDASIRSIDLEDGSETTTRLSSPGVDMHNNPSFTFDSEGRIVVFYSLDGGYSDQKQIARSVDPWDISNFEVLHETLASELTGNVGRQSGMWSDRQGTIFMQNYTVYGGARRELLFISEDDGQTFREHTLWSFALEDDYNDRSYTYSFYDAGRNRLHFMALDKNMEEPISHGLYYVYYDVEADRFFRADGEFAFDWSDTPITNGHDYMDVITDPEKGHSRPFWSSINVDDDGNAYLTWGSRTSRKGEGMIGGHVEEYWSRHDGDQWRHYPVGNRTGWRTGSHINPRNPHEVYLAVTVDDRTTQVQKRRFDEESGEFVLAANVSAEIPVDINDSSAPGHWAPSGPPSPGDSDRQIVVWNFGRFMSQYGRRGGFEGSIRMGEKPISAP